MYAKKPKDIVLQVCATAVMLNGGERMQRKNDLGFDTREIEWYLECNGKTLEQMIKWAKKNET